MVILILLTALAFYIAHLNPAKLTVSLPLVGTFRDVHFAIFFILTVFSGALLMALFNLVKDSQRAVG